MKFTKEEGTNNTGSQDLAEVVRLNEEIKRVMRISREVDMTALNAMLMARRADGRVAGFIMVATELRRFGHDLNQNMQSFGLLLHDLVGQVATIRKRVRMLRHFERAAEDERTRLVLAEVLLRQNAVICAAGERLSADKDGLYRRLGHALRLCDMGRVLSRNAAIEAVYAGSSASMLTEVSRHAGDAIDAVVITLNDLETALAITQ